MLVGEAMRQLQPVDSFATHSVMGSFRSVSAVGHHRSGITLPDLRFGAGEELADVRGMTPDQQQAHRGDPERLEPDYRFGHWAATMRSS